MSTEPHFAIALAPQPLILVGAPALLLLVVLAVVVVRKRRKSAVSPWVSASDELDIDYVKAGSGQDAVMRGRVNNHMVHVAPTTARGRGKKKKSTLYNVKYQAPEAPKFILMKRVDERTPVLDTGNPKFDAVVSVRTEDDELFAAFLTPARRAAILRLLTYWPVAQITNHDVHLKTAGVENDHDKLVDTVCHLVATAETFDRPTPIRRPASDDTTPSSLDSEMDRFAAGRRPNLDMPADTAAGDPTDDRDLLTEVRLDEAAVLGDLFGSGLDQQGTAVRFAQVYRGRTVTWTGEVLRIGSIDGDRQRIAAFIGSADGQNPASGRVVALTTVPIDSTLSEGDVVSFTGTLVNLEPAQRLFHVG